MRELYLAYIGLYRRGAPNRANIGGDRAAKRSPERREEGDARAHTRTRGRARGVARSTDTIAGSCLRVAPTMGIRSSARSRRMNQRAAAPSAPGRGDARLCTRRRLLAPAVGGCAPWLGRTRLAAGLAPAGRARVADAPAPAAYFTFEGQLNSVPAGFTARPLTNVPGIPAPRRVSPLGDANNRRLRPRLIAGVLAVLCSCLVRFSEKLLSFFEIQLDNQIADAVKSTVAL